MKKNKFELYTPDGWLNVEGIAQIPSIWLIVIVGARQVGKTYGILKHVMTHSEAHTLYLRRTIDELDMVSTYRDLNPFLPLAGEGIEADIQKLTKKVFHFGLSRTVEVENKNGDIEKKSEIYDERGLGLALNTIAQMRGFNGSQFTDVFFDEFIPEKLVVKRKGEGDALLNAYTTINGNRELKGKPPLKMWLAANAFDISSPILASLNLTNAVVEMSRAGEEYRIIEGGVFLCIPRSQAIIQKRQQTAMLSYLSGKTGASEFYDTAVNNSFAYDSLDLIRPKPLSGYHPYCIFNDMYVWANDTSFYVCRSRHNKRMKYGSTSEEKIRAQMDFARMKERYFKGMITFSDAETLLQFRSYFKIML